ncbi:MAG: DUF302 domain-containing protein [Nitrospinae bacterium]|nr:DUF302 domain-containing protein [Nitrospinota bacterium]
MKTNIGIERRFKGDFQNVMDRTIAALKAEGFGVLTTVDVKTTLKEKLNVDYARYVILGVCNPPLAYKALSTTKEVGLFLPCNVIVYEDATGEIVVSAFNPLLINEIMPESGLSEMAGTAHSKLTTALGKI